MEQLHPGQAITTCDRQLPLRRRQYAALCVLVRALATPRRAYWLSSGAAVYAWQSGEAVCADLRHIPASHGRRLYVEGRDTAQSIALLVRYASLTEDDLQAALGSGMRPAARDKRKRPRPAASATAP